MSNHTPGPWEWFTYDRAGGIYLATPDRGHLIVMDFVRQGMQSGQPRFAKWEGEERERMGGIMVPAERIGDTLRNHPDARLIAAAPELLAAAKAVGFFASVIKSGEPWTTTCEAAMAKVSAAIAKAESGAA